MSGVRESDFNGEGLSFQMCSRMIIRDSVFDGNCGNGLHPGAGSTGVLFENCQGKRNGKSGFFFCVRANHVTVRHCAFSDNEIVGVSIGSRDCYNLIEDCDISNNASSGIYVRQGAVPIEVHSCVIRDCRVRGNAHDTREAQIDIFGASHDLVIERNVIDGLGETSGIATADGTANIFLAQNEIANCAPKTAVDGFTTTHPSFECGCESTKTTHSRHLKPN